MALSIRQLLIAISEMFDAALPEKALDALISLDKKGVPQYQFNAPERKVVIKILQKLIAMRPLFDDLEIRGRQIQKDMSHAHRN